MTFNYYLKEEKKKGKAEGLAEGEASKAREMAKAMKNEGIDINTVVKISGLSKEEIEKL